MKIANCCVILATLISSGIPIVSSAITPDGTPGGGNYSSPSPNPRTYSAPAPDFSPARPSTRPSSGGKPILENPTAAQVRKALGIGQPKTRDIAALKSLGFGSFVEFETGSARVIPTNGLSQILEALLDLEDYASILITGHTDNQGGDAYNMDLSRRRAASVKQWLEINGVRRGAIKTRGMGFHQPAASNATESGRQRNRRVEFTRIDGQNISDVEEY